MDADFVAQISERSHATFESAALEILPETASS